MRINEIFPFKCCNVKITLQSVHLMKIQNMAKSPANILLKLFFFLKKQSGNSFTPTLDRNQNINTNIVKVLNDSKGIFIDFYPITLFCGFEKSIDIFNNKIIYVKSFYCNRYVLFSFQWIYKMLYQYDKAANSVSIIQIFVA